jgi:cyclophilin family peptidyl-prolyl cis-trans isomerase
MSKAKVTVRRPIATAADDAAELLPRWQGRPWRPLLISAIIIAAVLASGLAISDALKAPRPASLASCVTSTQTGTYHFIGPQPICIVPKRAYQATVNTTKGPITIQLYPQIAPVTVNNFIVLALNGYYNGMPFATQDWVVQSGDPTGDGRGGPGYTLPDEPNSSPDWGLGAVGMARPIGSPVNGSQFFIQRAAWPGNGPTAVYNRFGTVVKGLGAAGLLTSPSDRITSITIQVG